jgi:hypothetical protein
LKSDAGAVVGLCADCVHSERITSARGSTFHLCRLSATDPRFPKYPRLPVLACEGFRGKPAGGPADKTDDAGKNPDG